MKRFVSLSLAIILVVGVLSSMYVVQPVKAEETIYIRADGSIDPPTADIISADNVTYTFTDSIYSSIVVERSSIVVDGNGYAVQGNDNGDGFYWNGTNNVTVKNTNIRNFECGVLAANSSSNIICGNNITGNIESIYFFGSSNNNISGNNIAVLFYGLHLGYSLGNTVSGNNITDIGGGYGVGVALYSSSDNLILENNITANAGGIQLDSSSGNSISGNNITNSYSGLALWSSSNNIISGNNITNNGYGICLYDYSLNSSVSGNNITNNWAGILLDSSSNYNSVSGNNITNSYSGIWLESSSNYNTISGNNITNNNYGGIWLYYSSNNKLFHNSFFNNNIQVYSIIGSANIWDDDYPSGGNYWSDYTGVDANGDGIGDAPYIIDGNNQDRYPLVHSYGSIVNSNTSLTYLTIQSAINAPETLNGHTIFVRSGIYYENVVVNKALNLRGENRNSTIVDGNNTGNVVTLVSNNANVSGFTFQHSAGALYSCIRLDQVSGCSIFSNIANNSNSSASGDGIFLQSSERNNISDNLVINTWDGITFWGSSGNTISGNTVVNLFNVGGTSIQFCYGSAFNQAIGNAFLGIAQIGIRCYQGDSGSNVLIGNRVENHYHGIYADGSSNNIFYHNSIVNNTINQAYVPYSVNVWDDGYPSGGNYWSDYNGSDLYLGEFQTEPGSDGIGDTSYVIDGNNTDHYPLMSPWTPPDVAVINVTSAKRIIGEGYSAYLTAVVENQGGKVENLNTTVYVGQVNVTFQTFLLKSQNSLIHTFSWDSTGFSKGNYTLSTYVEPIEGEEDLADNTMYNDWVFVTIPGDVNGDKKVNILDAIVLSDAIFSEPSGPNWNASADINNDGKVNILDCIILANHFNQHWA